MKKRFKKVQGPGRESSLSSFLFYLQIPGNRRNERFFLFKNRAGGSCLRIAFRFTARYPPESKQSFLIDKIGGRLSALGSASGFGLLLLRPFYECGKIHSASRSSGAPARLQKINEPPLSFRGGEFSRK